MNKIEVLSPKHGYKEILIDESDFDYLSQFKWSVAKKEDKFYAFSWAKGMNKKGGPISMHRLLLNVTDSHLFVDHIDGNGLNNKRSNIRIATYRQNSINKKSKTNGSSKYLGVSKHHGVTKYKSTITGTETKYCCPKTKWCAQINSNGKNKYLGIFINEIDAAKSYDKAAKEIHGEWANLNFKD